MCILRRSATQCFSNVTTFDTWIPGFVTRLPNSATIHSALYSEKSTSHNISNYALVFLVSVSTSSSQPPPLPSWITVSYKRDRSMQESSDRVAKHVKDNNHLSPPTITSNRYTSLPNEVQTRTVRLPQPQPVLLPSQKPETELFGIYY
jgi:hypothetical protein